MLNLIEDFEKGLFFCTLMTSCFIVILILTVMKEKNDYINKYSGVSALLKDPSAQTLQFMKDTGCLVFI